MVALILAVMHVVLYCADVDCIDRVGNTLYLGWLCADACAGVGDIDIVGCGGAG